MFVHVEVLCVDRAFGSIDNMFLLEVHGKLSLPGEVCFVSQFLLLGTGTKDLSSV